MTQTYIKNRLYLLPVLLVCISLQTTATTQPNTEQTITQSLPDSNLTHNQNSRYIKPKPKPNNIGSQNNTTTYNMTEPYNIPYPQNSIEQQNMAGWHNMTGSDDPHYVAQQNRIGFPDNSFGPDKNGYVISTMGFDSVPRAVIAQKNNKIVVAGERDRYAVLAQYNNNGELNANFGTGNYGPGGTQGVTIQLNMGRPSSFNALAIQECDQKIVAVGSSNGKSALARYYNNGTLDTTFNANGSIKGIIQTNIIGELNAVALQKDNKIVVAGRKNADFGETQIVLIRYNENGTLDNGFGEQGIVTPIRFARAHAVTIQEHDDKIVAVGINDTGSRNDTIIVRYNKNGTRDQSFGPNRSGVTILQIGKNHSAAYDVIVQKDGNILVVGSSISPSDKNVFTIIRLNEDGLRDTSFGTNGVITITPPHFGSNDSYARSVVLDKNDNIIVMGYAIIEFSNNLSFNVPFLVRYDQNGTLDQTFGLQGVTYVLLDNNQAKIPFVGTIQNNNEKLIVAGGYSNTPTKNNQFVVARLQN